MPHCNSICNIEASIIDSVDLCEELAFHLQEAESVHVSSQLNSGRFLHLFVTQEKEAERTKGLKVSPL